MSDTPLTDINRGYVTDDPPTLTKHISGLFVPANFAGGLERALNDARLKLARYQQAMPEEPGIWMDTGAGMTQVKRRDFLADWVELREYDALARAYAALKVENTELKRAVENIDLIVENNELKAKLVACEKDTRDKALNVCADLADYMLRGVAGGKNVGKGIRALKENNHE